MSLPRSKKELVALAGNPVCAKGTIYFGVSGSNNRTGKVPVSWSGEKGAFNVLHQLFYNRAFKKRVFALTGDAACLNFK